MDWILRRLADRLGVEPARSGEAITPRIRFEQPWSQGATILVVVGCAALIFWLYRREGNARPAYKFALASIRFTLVLLVLFMLAEAVLSVERTGLPNFVILWDDSASQQVIDHPADPKVKAALAALAKAGEPPVDPKSTSKNVATSRSQTGSNGDDPSRVEIARGRLLQDDAKLLAELAKQNKVRIYRMSRQAVPLAEIDRPADLPRAIEAIRTVQASGDQSRLGASVKQVLTELRGVAPSAVLLMTDGQNTDDESLTQAAELAARKGTPIFVVGLGDPEPPRDLALSDLLVDDVAFVDDLIRFQAKLTSKGYAGQEVTIKLGQKAGDPDDPAAPVQHLESIRVVAPADNEVKPIEIGYRPKQTGSIAYVIEIEPKPREIQSDNNKITRVIDVRKQKLKVLLADGEPRYEYRYLKNFLERDETIDLNVVLISSDPEYSVQDRSAIPTFPTSKEEIFAYDVIIFGDVDPSFLTPSQTSNLVEFVTTKGGGLLFVAGESFDPISYRATPLEILLPVETTDARDPATTGGNIKPFRPRLTAEGRSNPIFRLGEDEASSMQIWDNLPELYWYLEAPHKKPTALALAEHPDAVGADGPIPLVLTQFVGTGKTMYTAFDGSWRWRMRVGDRYFGRYWIQTIRYLARSKLMGQKQAEVSTDRKRYQRGKPIRVRVRFPNPALAPSEGELNVQVQKKNGGPRTITLKSSPAAKMIFEGTIPQPSEGEYTIKLLPPPVLQGEVPTTTFVVDPPAGEIEAVQLNRPELLRVAELTGGKFYTPETSESILKDLPKAQKVPLDTDPPIPLWNTWPILALFTALITAEWIIRKRLHMV